MVLYFTIISGYMILQIRIKPSKNTIYANDINTGINYKV